MRKLLLFLGFALIITSCGKHKNFKISGNIENAKGQTLFLEKVDLSGGVLVDSVKLGKNGSFTFKGKRLTEPTFFRLKLTNANFITLLADTTEKIELTANGTGLEDSYVVKNSIGSSYIKILNRKFNSTRQVLDSLTLVYSKLGASDVEQKTDVELAYIDAFNSQRKFIGEFVMDNPRSFASYYALFQEISNGVILMNVMDKQDQVYFATLATSLNLLYPDSERVKHLYNYVLSAKEAQRRAKIHEALLSQGTVSIPEIEAWTPDGEMVKLSSTRGKLVLLSFWAAWDKNSRLENRTLKKIYEKYRSRGFEIYQVSLDQSKVMWESAIEQDELTWINVSDLRYTNSYPAKLYNVTSLPANYLISRDGEIVGKDLFGSRLDEKIGELIR
jgi:peroxiredoxin